MLKTLKKTYKRKASKKSQFEPTTLRSDMWRGLEKIYGEKIVDDILELDELHLFGRKVSTSHSKKNYFYQPKPNRSDFLADDVIDFLRVFNFNKLDLLRQYRNKVAHCWEYKKTLSKKFKTPQNNLPNVLKRFCSDLLKELGLDIRQISGSGIGSEREGLNYEKIEYHPIGQSSRDILKKICFPIRSKS